MVRKAKAIAVYMDQRWHAFQRTDLANFLQGTMHQHYPMLTCECVFLTVSLFERQQENELCNESSIHHESCNPNRTPSRCGNMMLDHGVSQRA